MNDRLTELYKELAKATNEVTREQIKEEIEKLTAKTKHNDRSYPVDAGKIVFIRK